jgi:hypothetical protein
MTTRRWLAAMLILLCIPATTPADEKTTIDDYYIDFGVSELTALTLIGVNTSRVLRPGSMKALATGFLTVAETGSDIKPGVAVEWTPVRPDRSLSQYRKSKLKYFQLAFGTVKNRDVTDFGLGARWNIFDRSDPLGDKSYHDRILAAVDTVLTVSQSRDNEIRMQFVEQVKKHLLDLMARLEQQGGRTQTEIRKITGTLAGKIWNLNQPPEFLLAETVTRRAARYYEEMGLYDVAPGGEAVVEELAEAYVRTIEDINRHRDQTDKQINRIVGRERKAFRNNSWNAPVLTLGAGWISRSIDSSWRELKGDRFSGFAGGAFPMGRRFQGIVQIDGRVAARDSVDERSFWGAGGRVIAAYGDRRISAEGYYSSANSRDPETDTSIWRITVGLELKLTKGVWFEVAIGGEFDDNSDDSTILILGNIKYGFRKEPRFETGN